MVQLEHNPGARPLCPHCRKELDTIWYQEHRGDLGKRCLYLCPHCRAVLGLSHRKGLTFGW